MWRTLQPGRNRMNFVSEGAVGWKAAQYSHPVHRMPTRTTRIRKLRTAQFVFAHFEISSGATGVRVSSARAATPNAIRTSSLDDEGSPESTQSPRTARDPKNA